jgi:recombination endonuclease VII
MAMMKNLTHERLTEVLDYDSATGIFVWKVRRGYKAIPGARAGVFHQASGGRYIALDDEKFMAHRLAWFYVHKRWPDTDARPLDGNYDNCAIGNLKEVSRVELQHARGRVSTNTSGYAGVSIARKGKWQAKITWNYKQIALGANFETAEDASEAYQEAERRLKDATNRNWEKIVEELRVWKGQRTAWRFLERHHATHAWRSFEDFCCDVVDVPTMRYAMVPVDASLPIGPGNFRFAFPPNATRTTPEGIEKHNHVRRVVNRDYMRDKHLKSNYDIDYSDELGLLNDQAGVCAICNKPEIKMQNGEIQKLSVDHEHETGVVRGLLCAACNYGLGYFKDNPDTLRKAAEYLERKKPWFTPKVIEITHTPVGQQILEEYAGHG